MDSKIHSRYNAISIWLSDLKPLQKEMTRAARHVSENDKERADIMRSYIIAVDRMLVPVYVALEMIRERVDELAKAEQAMVEAELAFERINGLTNV